MMNMKKKLIIASLAVAMITVNSFDQLRLIHGENKKDEVVSKHTLKTGPVAPKKAFYTGTGDVKNRTDANDEQPGTTVITDLTTITDLMIGNGVRSIPADKFQNLPNLTTLTFKGAEASTPADKSLVASIGANAFKGSGIASVTLPPALTSIGASAFANNTALANVNFTHATLLANIGQGAFENSGLTAVDLSLVQPAADLTILSKAFKGNKKLLTAKLSSKMTVLESEVFASTGITTIEIPEKIATIKPFAFNKTPLANLTVNATNTNFSAEANVLYNQTKAKLLLFPEGNTTAEFTLPDTVTHIEANAFSASYLNKGYSR